MLKGFNHAMFLSQSGLENVIITATTGIIVMLHFSSPTADNNSVHVVVTFDILF